MNNTTRFILPFKPHVDQVSVEWTKLDQYHYLNRGVRLHAPVINESGKCLAYIDALIDTIDRNDEKETELRIQLIENLMSHYKNMWG